MLASSKTDQEGQGQRIAIPRIKNSPYCPVQVVSDWLVAADISTGPVFRRMDRGDTVADARLTDQSVALVIKHLALQIGLDPSRYAGHSLRSGFLTSAARRRANILKMAEQSRHKSLDVLREYVRDEARFDDQGLSSRGLGCSFAALFWRHRAVSQTNLVVRITILACILLRSESPPTEIFGGEDYVFTLVALYPDPGARAPAPFTRSRVPRCLAWKIPECRAKREVAVVAPMRG